MAKLHVSIRGSVQLVGEVRELEIDAECNVGSWCVGALVADLLRKHFTANPQFAERQADAVVLALSVVNVGKPTEFYAPLFAASEVANKRRGVRSNKKGVDHERN